MARRRCTSRNARSGGGVNTKVILMGLVAILLVVVVVQMVGSGGSEASSANISRDFRVAEYRKSASRLSGNSYRLEAKVEGIMARRNDRLVVVSVAGNPKDERLPILVKEDTANGVNLSRGKTYIFNVECRNGYDSEGEPISGVLVTRSVENKL